MSKSSYDALENLAGCHIHSADEILDEHQQLTVGDIIRSALTRTRAGW